MLINSTKSTIRFQIYVLNNKLYIGLHERKTFLSSGTGNYGYCSLYGLLTPAQPLFLYDNFTVFLCMPISLEVNCILAFMKTLKTPVPDQP